MKVLGLIGWSGSGKTTLLVSLVPQFRARGLRVSTVKHAHHGFDLDQKGKDSWRHREAGAHEVIVASRARFALLHENEGEEPALPVLLARLAPVDLVLVEGFKASPHPKIEVHRAEAPGEPFWPDRSDVVAVASDVPLPHCTKPVLNLGDPAAIVAWSLDFLAGS